MPKFKKSTGFKMKGYTYPGESPLKQDKKVTGEQTGTVKKDKKGKDYVIQEYDTQANLQKGDTVYIPPVQKVSIIEDAGDEYLMGGDYTAKETKKSKKRKKGPKTYTLK